MGGPKKPAPYVESRTPEQIAKDAADYNAYSNAVDASAAKGGGIGAGGVKDFADPNFVRDNETDEQRRIREGLATVDTSTPQAPDLTDALIKSYSRSALLKNRLSSTGRRGSFLAGSMGDVTKDPGGSILGGM